MPIWDWTLKDIKTFINSRKLKLAQVYYTDSGDIDFSKRLGCQGCPLTSDRGVADFKKNTSLLKAWLRAGVNYTHTHLQNLTTTHLRRLFVTFFLGLMKISKQRFLIICFLKITTVKNI